MNAYRIGDVYRGNLNYGKWWMGGSVGGHVGGWVGRNIMYPLLHSNTIAYEYIKRNCSLRKEQWGIMYSILSERKYTGNVRVKPNELLLHIRVGDVLCLKKLKTDYTKKNNTDWWLGLIKFVRTNKIGVVHIMYGNHLQTCMGKSKDFIKDRVQFLQAHGISQIHHIEGNHADDDILIVKDQVHYIASTGGGYGAILIQTAEAFNQATVYCSNNPSPEVKANYSLIEYQKNK